MKNREEQSRIEYMRGKCKRERRGEESKRENREQSIREKEKKSKREKEKKSKREKEKKSIREKEKKSIREKEKKSVREKEKKRKEAYEQYLLNGKISSSLPVYAEKQLTTEMSQLTPRQAWMGYHGTEPDKVACRFTNWIKLEVVEMQRNVDN